MAISPPNFNVSPISPSVLRGLDDDDSPIDRAFQQATQFAFNELSAQKADERRRERAEEQFARRFGLARATGEVVPATEDRMSTINETREARGLPSISPITLEVGGETRSVIPTTEVEKAQGYKRRKELIKVPGTDIEAPREEVQLAIQAGVVDELRRGNIEVARGIAEEAGLSGDLVTRLAEDEQGFTRADQQDVMQRAQMALDASRINSMNRSRNNRERLARSQFRINLLTNFEIRDEDGNLQSMTPDRLELMEAYAFNPDGLTQEQLEEGNRLTRRIQERTSLASISEGFREQVEALGDRTGDAFGSILPVLWNRVKDDEQWLRDNVPPYGEDVSEGEFGRWLGSPASLPFRRAYVLTRTYGTFDELQRAKRQGRVGALPTIENQATFEMANKITGGNFDWSPDKESASSSGTSPTRSSTGGGAPTQDNDREPGPNEDEDVSLTNTQLTRKKLARVQLPARSGLVNSMVRRLRLGGVAAEQQAIAEEMDKFRGDQTRVVSSLESTVNNLQERLDTEDLTEETRAHIEREIDLWNELKTMIDEDPTGELHSLIVDEIFERAMDKAMGRLGETYVTPEEQAELRDSVRGASGAYQAAGQVEQQRQQQNDSQFR